MSWWDPKVAARRGQLHVPLGATPGGGEVLAIVPAPPAAIGDAETTYQLAGALYRRWSRTFHGGPPLPGRVAEPRS